MLVKESGTCVIGQSPRSPLRGIKAAVQDDLSGRPREWAGVGGGRLNRVQGD